MIDISKHNQDVIQESMDENDQSVLKKPKLSSLEEPDEQKENKRGPESNQNVSISLSLTNHPAFTKKKVK
jgi:hypothetical protein